MEEGWSVRKIEEETRTGRRRRKNAESRDVDRKDPILEALQEELRKVLGTRVVLRRARKGKGVIEISFLGTHDFERIFALITGREASEVVE